MWKFFPLIFALIFTVHPAPGQPQIDKITTFFMFEGQAEEAITFYTSLFDDSEIVRIIRHGPDGPGGPAAEGTVLNAVFTLNGNKYMAFDSPIEHSFTFTPSISLFVQCDSEEELVSLYEKLMEDGTAAMPLGEYGFSKKFGWVQDRFGVSWQLNYGRLVFNENNNTDNSDSLSLGINIDASAAKVWDVITNPKYAKILGNQFDENAFIKSDWQEGSDVHFAYEPDNIVATGIITELVEYQHIKMDYDFDGFAYNETFVINENDNAVTLSVHAGPYGENIEAHRIVWNNWLKKVKELSENS